MPENRAGFIVGAFYLLANWTPATHECIDLTIESERCLMSSLSTSSTPCVAVSVGDAMTLIRHLKDFSLDGDGAIVTVVLAADLSLNRQDIDQETHAPVAKPY